MKSFVASLFVLLSVPAFASAHGLNVRVDVNGNTVAVIATFDGDDPADDCVVTVTAADGTVVAKGPTDKAGRFTFPSPSPGSYEVVADAGAGHLAKKSLLITSADEPMNGPAPSDERLTYRRHYLGIAGGLLGILAGTAILSRRAKRT